MYISMNANRRHLRNINTAQCIIHVKPTTQTNGPIDKCIADTSSLNNVRPLAITSTINTPDRVAHSGR